MTQPDRNAISLDELSAILESYAGPSRPQRQSARRSRRPLRLAYAVAAIALLGVGAAYAAGFDPFSGISAANHPAGPNDRLPAFLVTDIDRFNSELDRMGKTGHLLIDSTRFVSELPSGMRFYTISTELGQLCLANVYPPGSSDANGGIACGDSLGESNPITRESQRPNEDVPQTSFGLAMDGVTAISFMAGGIETTVPVKENVWAHEGQADLTSVTVHWEDGRTQTVSG